MPLLAARFKKKYEPLRVKRETEQSSMFCRINMSTQRKPCFLRHKQQQAWNPLRNHCLQLLTVQQVKRLPLSGSFNCCTLMLVICFSTRWHVSPLTPNCCAKCLVDSLRLPSRRVRMRLSVLLGITHWTRFMALFHQLLDAFFFKTACSRSRNWWANLSLVSLMEPVQM